MTSQHRVSRWIRGFGKENLVVEYPLPEFWTLERLQRLFSVPEDNLMYDCYPIGEREAAAFASTIPHTLVSNEITFFVEADSEE